MWGFKLDGNDGYWRSQFLTITHVFAGGRWRRYVVAMVASNKLLGRSGENNKRNEQKANKRRIDGPLNSQTKKSPMNCTNLKQHMKIVKLIAQGYQSTCTNKTGDRWKCKQRRRLHTRRCTRNAFRCVAFRMGFYLVNARFVWNPIFFGYRLCRFRSHDPAHFSMRHFVTTVGSYGLQCTLLFLICIALAAFCSASLFWLFLVSASASVWVVANQNAHTNFVSRQNEIVHLKMP